MTERLWGGNLRCVVGRTKWNAQEMACLSRFGTRQPQGEVPIIRSDNGLIFQSRRFREACRFYCLPQEFMTPYTPEQNGLIEFLRT
jgi:putative transposase